MYSRAVITVRVCAHEHLWFRWAPALETLTQWMGSDRMCVVEHHLGDSDKQASVSVSRSPQEAGWRCVFSSVLYVDRSQNCVFSYLLPGIIVIYLYPPKVKALSRASGRLLLLFCCCNSVQFSRSVVSNSLQPHELQHARPPCPSPTPGVHSNSRPSTCCCN